jgi:hypothetical protein
MSSLFEVKKPDKDNVNGCRQALHHDHKELTKLVDNWNKKNGSK